MIDLVDAKETGKRRLAVSEGIESGSKYHVLQHATPDSFFKTVLRIPAAHGESRSPLFRKGMVEQWRQPSLIVFGVD